MMNAERGWSLTIHHAALVISLLVTACAPSSRSTPVAASLTFPVPDATLAPQGPPPTPVCDGILPAPPHYEIDLRLDYAAHIAQVTEAIQLVNDSSDAWRDISLVVSANHVSGVFDLHALTVDGYPASYVLEGVALRILLPVRLEPGCRLALGANYTLNLPRLNAAVVGWRGALGWTTRQSLLGLWYPTLAPYQDGAGWLAHAPAIQGEYATTEASHVALKLTLTGEAVDLTLVGSAPGEACGAAEAQIQESAAPAICFELQGGRHFALAFSDQMDTATAKARDVAFTSMYFPEHSAAGMAVLNTTRDAFAAFTDRFGPVPYTSISAVEADLVDGMEFSGIFFLGRPYFGEFDGSPQNHLTALAAHETAHQWWYSLVGNDPAAEPWLDEALATYSEEIYYEAYYPHLVEWWWGFRVWQYLPDGAVDSDIYVWPDFRSYVDAVYLNGAQFLHTLRGEIGDEAFFEFLRAYAATGAGKIVTAEDFWRVYDTQGGDAASSTARISYFSP